MVLLPHPYSHGRHPPPAVAVLRRTRRGSSIFLAAVAGRPESSARHGSMARWVPRRSDAPGTPAPAPLPQHDLLRPHRRPRAPAIEPPAMLSRAPAAGTALLRPHHQPRATAPPPPAPSSGAHVAGPKLRHLRVEETDLVAVVHPVLLGAAHSSVPPPQAGPAALPLLLHAVGAGRAGGAAPAPPREICWGESREKRAQRTLAH